MPKMILNIICEFTHAYTIYMSTKHEFILVRKYVNISVNTDVCDRCVNTDVCDSISCCVDVGTEGLNVES